MRAREKASAGFRPRLRFLYAVFFFFACFQGKNSCYDRNNAVNG